TATSSSSTSSSTTSSSTTTSSSSTTTTTSSSDSECIPVYGNCLSASCCDGSYCSTADEYYAQCLPGTATSSSSTSSSTTSSSTTTSSSSTTTTTSSSDNECIPVYGNCLSASCCDGSYCSTADEYYAQCLPGTSNTDAGSTSAGALTTVTCTSDGTYQTSGT
ncbi:hypothetical protein C6P40_005500, partial [Pichia californica]